jgi:WD40 repeat protein
MYDMRMPQSTGQQFTHHYSTVTAIDGFGDYIVTGGLDKRIMVHDTRMMHAQNIVRDLDSAVLSLSVSPQFICATSTLTGIHFVNLSAGNLPICKPENTPTSSRYNSICWNAQGNVLYGGGESCTLDLFSSTCGI